MGAIVKVSAFSGLYPKTERRLIPENAACVAKNVDLHAGTIAPINQPQRIITTATPAPVTIFLARDSSQQIAAWMSWQKEVDAVRVPFPSESESRFVWTGDGEPKAASILEITNDETGDYPRSFHALGIPNPTIKPVVTVSGGSGSVISRAYCYTFYSSDNEESGPSSISEIVSGAVDGTFNVAGMSEFPTNSGVGTATYQSGYTTFSNTANAPTWCRAGDEVIISGSVARIIEAPAAHQFKVAGNYSAATSWARRSNWNTEGMKRRLYRTAGTSASFQMVSDDVGTFYADSLSDADILGDEIISADWILPPEGLSGVVVHSSGALVGFVGNLIYATEPLQPHAWKRSSLSTDYPIVGLAAFGSEVAVLTQGAPYIASGVEPSVMTMQKLDGMYPCVSKRSIASVGNGAVFATAHGLAFVGTSGVNMVSEPYFTRDEWIPLGPHSMVCEYINGWLYCATVANGIYVFRDGPPTTIDLSANDLHADAATGSIYFADSDGIMLIDPSHTQPMPASWQSKEFVFPKPANLGAAKVDFDYAIDPVERDAILAERTAALATNAALRASGSFGGAFLNKRYAETDILGSDAVDVPEQPVTNDMTFTLVVKDEDLFSRTVSNQKAFRLPSGMKYDNAAFRVEGHGTVREIRVAETMTDLAQT